MADDDTDIRDLVTLKLTQSGHQVTAVDDGTAALRAARENTVDLAPLDIRMPGMSGLDVCRELRAAPESDACCHLDHRQVPGRGHRGGFAAGANDYIIKPFSPRELASRVTALLDRADK
ncbi:response regulator transcription factor [Streptomyces achromogenes]|uniref:response regulator transcription factor n=1 Tax=Streptomyces achromogenes TaxID=67255 RepID=UPI0027D7FABC|nr:response regulator [Streptomyces achromogenes]